MRYVTYYDSINGGLSDVTVHPDKLSAVKFYRNEAKYYFDVQIPAKIIPPTACGFAHRLYGIMSIRRFRKEFPEWKGGAKMMERTSSSKVKELKIHCDKNGISVRGARNIGSMSDTDASSKRDFLRICEVWWNTYVRGYTGSKGSGREPSRQ